VFDRERPGWRPLPLPGLQPLCGPKRPRTAPRPDLLHGPKLGSLLLVVVVVHTIRKQEVESRLLRL
jgi:hypothetical protein